MDTLMEREALNGRGELPEHYGEDTLVLLPKDPQGIFAYWEVSEDTLKRMEYQWGEDIFQQARRVLIIYRHQWEKEEPMEEPREKNMVDALEETIEETIRVDITPQARSWYLEVSHPDHRYHVEWGWLLQENHFEPLMKSNTVRTPRNRVSDLVDENWTLPEWKFRKLYRRISLFQVSSPELMRRRTFR